MPSIYAHRLFGEALFESLSPALQETVEKNRALFSMGLHGPDLLFFYKPLWKTDLGKMGNALHYYTGSQILRIMLDRTRSLPPEDRSAALAYTLGMACHYLLDSACHPYVERLVKADKATHCTIEGELELWLIAREGGEPLKTDPVSHLADLSEEDYRIIAAHYAALSRLIYPDAPLKALPREIASAHRTLLWMNHVFSSPSRLIRAFAHTGLFLAGGYDQRKGLVYHREPDPAFDGCSAQLYALLQGALTDAPAHLQALAEDPAAVEAPIWSSTFEG